MIILGIILAVLGAFGIARAILVPVGIGLILLGIVVNVIAFAGHAFTVVF